MTFITFLLITLASIMAAPAIMMVLRKEKARKILEHDAWGWLVFCVGSALAGFSYLLFLVGGVWPYWAVFVNSLASFIAACGFLILLPDKVSDKLIARRNIGLVLIIAGVVAVFYYTIAPTWRYVVQAFKIIWNNTGLSQGLALILSTIFIVVGVLIFKKKERISP
jgi:hypothetical protein